MNVDKNYMPTFPADCYKNIMSVPDDCARLTLVSGGSQSMKGISVPVYNVSKEVTHTHVLQFLRGQFQTSIQADIVGETELFVHATVLSSLWGFVDDVGILISCDPRAFGSTLVQLHSEQRMGTQDSGVNAKRLKDLIASLDAAVAAEPQGFCSQIL